VCLKRSSSFQRGGGDHKERDHTAQDRFISCLRKERVKKRGPIKRKGGRRIPSLATIKILARKMAGEEKAGKAIQKDKKGGNYAPLGGPSESDSTSSYLPGKGKGQRTAEGDKKGKKKKLRVLSKIHGLKGGRGPGNTAEDKEGGWGKRSVSSGKQKEGVWKEPEAQKRYVIGGKLHWDKGQKKKETPPTTEREGQRGGGVGCLKLRGIASENT